MKKYTTILVLLLSIGNLTAKAHTEVTPQTGDGYIDIWIPIEGDKVNIERLFKDYNVRLTFIPKSDFRDKLEFGYKSGLLPDMTFVDYSFMSQLLKSDVLEPIEVFVNGLDGIYRSKIIPGALESNMYNSLLYGLPISFETEVLYYNKKHLSSPPILLTDWVTSGEQQFQERGISIGSIEQRGDYGSVMFNRYLSQYNTTSIEELNTAYIDLFTQFYSIYNSNDRVVLDRENSFERGLVSTKVENRAYLEKLNNYFPELDYGVTLIPALNEETASSSTISGINVIMNPLSEDLELTWKVMKLLTYDTHGNKTIAEYFGQLPTLNSAAETFEEFITFIDQARQSSLAVDYKDYSRVLKSLYEGQLTPEEAANLFAPIPKEPVEPESL